MLGEAVGDRAGGVNGVQWFVWGTGWVWMGTGRAKVWGGPWQRGVTTSQRLRRRLPQTSGEYDRCGERLATNTE